MKGDLYLKLMQSVQLGKERVTLGDIAELEWEDKSGLARLKETEIFVFPKSKQTRYVLSALYLIDRIHQVYPGLTVNAIGESDIVVERASDKRGNRCIPVIKVVLVCLIVLFGASFAIMSFNNDVSVEKLFAQIYEKLTGQESTGFTILEMMYSIGLAGGILIFYNHFSVGKKSQDPTPVQVEMQMYEMDINHTLIEEASRSGIHVLSGMTKNTMSEQPKKAGSEKK